MNAFNGFIIEDLPACGTNDFGSGLQARLYYAPTSYFSKLDLPGEDDDFLIKEEDLKFKLLKGWAFMDCMIDEGEMRLPTVGSIARLKMTSVLNIFILGLRANSAQIIEKLLNTPLVFLVIDGNGKQWLLGNLKNPARIEKAEGTSGKKYEDNAGFAITIGSKSITYPVEGDSTQLYVNKNWIWVLGTDATTPILFNNNNLLEINKI